MVEDITNEFVKQKRQQLSDRHYDIYFLKQYVFDNCTLDGVIKSYISNNILFEVPDKVYRIRDNTFKNCLLNEANIQLNKALYNWSVYKRLVSKGLWSWAYITLYYSQFYSLIGLLNIQGNSFSRPLLTTPDRGKKEVQFHVYPEVFENGDFIFEMRRLNKPHDDIWTQYYNVFRKCDYDLKFFNELYQFDREHPFEAINLRNFMNYDISYDLIEYTLSASEFESLILKMKQNIFEIDYSDDDKLYIEYIASLRIKLLFSLLNDILKNSCYTMKRSELYTQRINMLNLTNDDTPVKECFYQWNTLE